MIQIRHLKKAYGNHVVFSDFSLDIPEEAVLCLMGESGRGKTTLLRILMGLEQMDEGEILGLERKRISAVFQEDRLLTDFTVKENLLAVCSTHEQKEKIQEILAAFGLSDWLEHPISKLSGGMMRRVAIARALLPDYDILILDEPFRGLDEKTRVQVAQYIKKQIQEKIVLIATHQKEDVSLFHGYIVQI